MGWTQEHLAQLIDRTSHTVMYMETRGQHPSLNVFYQVVTLQPIGFSSPIGTVKKANVDSG